MPKKPAAAAHCVGRLYVRYPMTELLGKIFIKNSGNVKDRTVRRAWGTLVSTVGVVMNLLLFAGKFAVGTVFGAVSVAADAINNLSDAGSQLISLVSFRISAKPADRRHPFGHARIEYVASMAVSFVILVIGFDLLRESAGKIFSHGETEFSWLSVAVLGVSVLVKLWLAVLNRKVGAKIDSSVMRAAAADSLSDVAATGAVLVSQLVLHFNGFNTDAYLGVAVSLLIMWAGVKILNDTKNSILGEAPDEKLVSEIMKLVNSYDGVLGVHDLMVHSYGPGRTIASLHVEVDGSADIFESHDLIDNIEKRLCDELGLSATIHLDPIVTDNGEVDSTRRLVRLKMEEIDPRFSIHDFRMVKGRTHTNLIFDVLAPFEQKMSDAEIKAAADAKLREIDPTFCGVITVDRG